MSDLHAKTAVRVGMFRVAFDANGAPAFIHLDEHGARIGTIVRTYSANDLHVVAGGGPLTVTPRSPFSFPVLAAAFFIASTRSPRR